MKVFIKDLTISGVKNIKDELKINFGKTNIQEREGLYKHNIKSIYGPNGSGKTAIVHSLYLLKNIVFDANFLNDNHNNLYMSELLNKNCEHISLGVEFYCFDKDNKPLIYNYKVKLKKENTFKIVEEYYSYRINESSVEHILFHSLNGDPVTFAFSDESKKKTYNLLTERSISAIMLNYAFELSRRGDIELVKEDFKKINPIITLSTHMTVVLDQEDMYLNLKRENDDFIDSLYGAFMGKRLDNISELTKGDDSIKNLDKKTDFLKLFKPDIKSIDLNKKLIRQDSKRSYYEYEKLINYGDYKVNLEYESMGIKKIFKLYDYLSSLSSGHIVVIDELDSHINDIFLTKILEFVYEYTKGQLIFTSHSITPMDTLRSGKNAIEFISISGKLTSWKQVGNYSPTNLYKQGMIDGLPFNIWPESLMKVFTDSDE